ncbi:MAG: ShlB/FhaC/HecB family hemolysin secretion/activation protein [Cyanobacteria bacterium J06621_8]
MIHQVGLPKVNRILLASSVTAIAMTLNGLNSPVAAGSSLPSGDRSDKTEIEVKHPKIPAEIIVTDFEVVGSSVFSPQELNQAVKSYRNRPLTLPELFQARNAITELYTEQGYLNTGAYIPPQELDQGRVQIAVIEGQLEAIKISGTKRLSPNYIISRVERAAGLPVNVDNLLAALQLLRLDPLIDNISAELSAGIRPGTSLLDIEIQEADVFNLSAKFDNQRSPSIGANQRSLGLNHGNLFGWGDRFHLEYANTDGSNAFELDYELPINSKNGTIKAVSGFNFNNVIEEPFNPLDIESRSRYYELTTRQPLLLKPHQEFALGLSFTRLASETFLLDESFQLARGANKDGETRISTIRLFQDYINLNRNQILAFRSQFSLGVDIFNPTINRDGEPDSLFLAWRGQGQWIKRLEDDFLLVLRGDAQLTGDDLLPLEQFRLGGFSSVRGYRQDLSLGDNGLFASVELLIPLWRWKKADGLLQIAPFLDVGTAWNNGAIELDNATLPSLGIGLDFTLGTRFNAHLDWGIPLISVEDNGDSLQEQGVYFSINSHAF